MELSLAKEFHVILDFNWKRILLLCEDIAISDLNDSRMRIVLIVKVIIGQELRSWRGDGLKHGVLDLLFFSMRSDI
jgi:hypothetical protein